MPPAEVVEGLVSTILPVHNRPEMLREAVASVLAQTYRPIEILIVDDASTDGTPAVCAQLVTARPDIVRVVALEVNGGPGAAREAGRLRTRGEFIQYLDSDDLLHPDKFELQVAALHARPDCGVASGRTTLLLPGSSREDGPIKRTGESIETMFPAFLQSRCWHTSTPLYRRSVTDAAGPWTTLCQEEDWEYDCRIAALGTRVVHVQRVLSRARAHEGPQLSAGASSSRRLLRDRATAHRLIYEHARSMGIDSDAPEMQHFSRELFLLARQCGVVGLEAESHMLFELSRRSSLGTAWQRGQFLAYRSIAVTLGWRRAARLADRYERMRGRFRIHEQLST